MLRLAYSAQGAARPATPPPAPPAPPARGQPPAVDATAMVAGVVAGDAVAARLLWREYAPLVRGLLRRSLGPTCDIDDATQDVFCRLLRGLAKLRKPESLRSFIIGVTLRVVGSELRTRHALRWFRLTSAGDLPEVGDDSVDHVSRAVVTRFYAVLDRVGTDERLCFVLRHLEELELTDVADALGVSLATVKRRLARVEARVTAMAQGDPLLADYLAEHAPRWSTSVSKRSHEPL